MRILLFILFLSQIILPAAAANLQKNVPKGSFSKSKLKIGEPVRYHLSIKHSKKMELLFPDQKFNYAPFELVSKEYYPTTTLADISLDSAVYVLRTFNVQDTIAYKLPVYTINTEGDSALLFPENSIIEIYQLTHDIKDTNHLEEMVSYAPMKIQPDYINTLATITLMLCLACIVFFFFRKGIVKRFRLYTIRQSHNSFNKNFEKLENDFIKTQRLPIMENALSLWKVYLTRLEGSPINTYTTTEIIALFHQEELAMGLQIIDKSIYRGMISGEPEKAFTILKKFSNQRYQKIKREIINE